MKRPQKEGLKRAGGREGIGTGKKRENGGIGAVAKIGTGERGALSIFRRAVWSTESPLEEKAGRRDRSGRGGGLKIPGEV